MPASFLGAYVYHAAAEHHNRDFKIYNAVSSTTRLQNVKKQREFKYLKQATVN